MKHLKRLLSLMAAAVLALGILAFTACGGSSDAYTIYLKDANGNAITNVKIGICTYEESTGQKGGCLNLETTDADGKVVFDEADGATEGCWTLNDLSTVFNTYEFPTEKYVFKAYGEYTVVLTLK